MKIIMLIAILIIVACNGNSSIEKKMESTLDIKVEGYYNGDTFKKLEPLYAPFFKGRVYKIGIQNNTKSDIYLRYIKQSNSIAFETVLTMRMNNDIIEGISFGIGSDSNSDFKLIKKGRYDFVYSDYSVKDEVTHIAVDFKYCIDSISNNILIEKDTLSLMKLSELK